MRINEVIYMHIPITSYLNNVVHGILYGFIFILSQNEQKDKNE